MLSRLGVALGANKNPINEKFDKEKTFSNVHKAFRQDDELPPIIKIEQKKLIEKQRQKEDEINEKYAYSNINLFSLKKKQFSQNKKRKKINVVKLKNNMLYSLNIPGCTPYDPYLINICKNAIYNVKDELPNYKEIINKINTEFGIEEGNNIVELNSDTIAFNTLNTFNSNKTNSKTRTNFTHDKNFVGNIENKTFSTLNKESEKTDTKREITSKRRGAKKK